MDTMGVVGVTNRDFTLIALDTRLIRILHLGYTNLIYKMFVT